MNNSILSYESIVKIVYADLLTSATIKEFSPLIGKQFEFYKDSFKPGSNYLSNYEEHVHKHVDFIKQVSHWKDYDRSILTEYDDADVLINTPKYRSNIQVGIISDIDRDLHSITPEERLKKYINYVTQPVIASNSLIDISVYAINEFAFQISGMDANSKYKMILRKAANIKEQFKDVSKVLDPIWKKAIESAYNLQELYKIPSIDKALKDNPLYNSFDKDMFALKRDEMIRLERQLPHKIKVDFHNLRKKSISEIVEYDQTKSEIVLQHIKKESFNFSIDK